MQLLSLSLSNFRIYKEAFFSFEEGVNGIIGNNAVGKTSLLEAIYICLFGRSFRTTELKELIREGEEFFRIEIEFLKNAIPQKLSITQNAKDRRILYNSTVTQNLTSLLGILHGVLIAPGDINLIAGSPSERRRFLDMQLSQIDPLYVHHLQRYLRAMKQRNYLLKRSQIDTIYPFEKEMAISAAYITQQRVLCVTKLANLSSEFYHYLTKEKENLSLKFVKMDNLSSDFYLSEYQRLKSKELMFGYTLTGPHKDDLFIKIDDKEARYFASEGQKNAAIAALKFAEWTLISERTKQIPLFMIDDLPLNLDAQRQASLCRKITEMGQSYFSSVSKPHFPFPNINWISISN